MRDLLMKLADSIQKETGIVIITDFMQAVQHLGPQAFQSNGCYAKAPQSDTGKDLEVIFLIDTPMSPIGSLENAARILLHEFAHASGHPNRLDRPIHRKPSSQATHIEMAFEESVAELTSHIVAKRLGINNQLTDMLTSKYLERFESDLSEFDKRRVIHEAQLATDYILDVLNLETMKGAA